MRLFRRLKRHFPTQSQVLIGVAVIVFWVFAGPLIYAGYFKTQNAGPKDNSNGSNNGSIGSANLAGVCSTPGRGFAEAAAYRGSGPHLMDIFGRFTAPGDTSPGEYDEWYHPGQEPTPDWVTTQPRSVQLVACVEEGPIGGKRVSSCDYEDNKGRSVRLLMYERTYKATIYVARTGATIGQISFVGHDDSCAVMDIIWVQEGEKPDLDTGPTDDDIETALKKFAEG